MAAPAHPLLDRAVVAQIEGAASAHLGRPWVSLGFTDLSARSSHPSGVLHGQPYSVFAKLGAGADAREQFTAELDGLRLLSRAAGIRTPVPVADGVIGFAAGALLLFEALPERPEAAPLDPGFAGRRELWRLPTYLAVIAVDGPSPLGRQCLTRLGDALRRYR